ncbi:hypothetical protein LINPERHAP2_LOCUS27744 [Linum perenne]
MISGAVASKVMDKIGFDSRLVEDARGFAGGIWVLWNKKCVNINERGRSEQAIHFEIKGLDDSSSLVSAVYASPYATSRTLLWDELREWKSRITLPWCLVGDFNCMLSAADKRGGAPFVPSRAASFRQCVDNCSLLELDYVGPCYTWFHGSLGEHIDWGLASTDWKCKFLDSVIRHLPRLRSDHKPIMICFQGLEIPNRKDMPFRFLVPWMTHNDFPSIFENSWDKWGNVAVNLSLLAEKLRKWNKEVFGNIFRRKAILSQQLSEIETCYSVLPSVILSSQEARIRKDLEQVLWEEALLWKQKACKDWIKDGDRNTRFFHLATLKRRSFNKISALKRADGSREDDAAGLKAMALAYFRLAARNLKSTSPLWKGMLKEWGTMLEGAKSAIRNGRETLFWTN